MEKGKRKINIIDIAVIALLVIAIGVVGIKLAGAIDVDICVEGIEEKDQYKILEDMQVKMVQGYYFDKPMRRQDFIDKYCDGRT